MKKIIATVLVIVLSLIMFSGCVTNSEQLLEMGKKYLDEEKYDKAIIPLKTYVKLNPDDGDAILLLAAVYDGAGKTNKFVETCELALEKGATLSDMLRNKYLVATDCEIVWVDETIERYVREYLGKPDGAIMQSELDGIKTVVSVPNYYDFISNESYEDSYRRLHSLAYEGVENEGNDIASCEDFVNFRNLKVLIIEGSRTLNISALSKLTNLSHLDLPRDNITDISSLANLTNLTELTLSWNDISNINSLSKLTQLTYLNIGYTKVTDISVVAGMQNLQNLDITCTHISDATPLYGLSNLSTFLIQETGISLEDITKLQAQLPDCIIILAYN